MEVGHFGTSKTGNDSRRNMIYDKNFDYIWEFLEALTLNISHHFGITFTEILSIKPTKKLAQGFALYISSEI
jgi:hypothetical protein